MRGRRSTADVIVGIQMVIRCSIATPSHSQQPATRAAATIKSIQPGRSAVDTTLRACHGQGNARRGIIHECCIV